MGLFGCCGKKDSEKSDAGKPKPKPKPKKQPDTAAKASTKPGPAAGPSTDKPTVPTSKDPAATPAQATKPAEETKPAVPGQVPSTGSVKATPIPGSTPTAAAKVVTPTAGPGVQPAPSQKVTPTAEKVSPTVPPTPPTPVKDGIPTPNGNSKSTAKKSVPTKGETGLGSIKSTTGSTKSAAGPGTASVKSPAVPETASVKTPSGPGTASVKSPAVPETASVKTPSGPGTASVKSPAVPETASVKTPSGPGTASVKSPAVPETASVKTPSAPATASVKASAAPEKTSKPEDKPAAKTDKGRKLSVMLKRCCTSKKSPSDEKIELEQIAATDPSTPATASDPAAPGTRNTVDLPKTANKASIHGKAGLPAEPGKEGTPTTGKGGTPMTASIQEPATPEQGSRPVSVSMRVTPGPATLEQGSRQISASVRVSPGRRTPDGGTRRISATMRVSPGPGTPDQGSRPISASFRGTPDQGSRPQTASVRGTPGLPSLPGTPGWEGTLVGQPFPGMPSDPGTPSSVGTQRSIGTILEPGTPRSLNVGTPTPVGTPGHRSLLEEETHLYRMLFEHIKLKDDLANRILDRTPGTKPNEKRKIQLAADMPKAKLEEELDSVIVDMTKMLDGLLKIQEHNYQENVKINTIILEAEASLCQIRNEDIDVEPLLADIGSTAASATESGGTPRKDDFNIGLLKCKSEEMRLRDILLRTQVLNCQDTLKYNRIINQMEFEKKVIDAQKRAMEHERSGLHEKLGEFEDKSREKKIAEIRDMGIYHTLDLTKQLEDSIILLNRDRGVIPHDNTMMAERMHQYMEQQRFSPDPGAQEYRTNEQQTSDSYDRNRIAGWAYRQ